MRWDNDFAMFRPDVDKAPTGADGSAFVSPAGAANGHFGLAELVGDAYAMGQAAARALGLKPKKAAAPDASSTEEAAMAPSG